jgi:FKBP-type peptidyl-prolyl cis-trans isomerase
LIDRGWYPRYLFGGKTFDSGTHSFMPAEVMKGWRLAMERMHIGDKWEITLPAELGYRDGRGTSSL